MLPRLSVTAGVCEVVDIRPNAMIRLPAVLAAPKGVATDVSGPAIPLDVLDCTSAIDMLIVMPRAWVVVAKLASVTRTVKLLVPATVGVPEITPAPESVSPVGSVLAAMDQV